MALSAIRDGKFPHVSESDDAAKVSRDLFRRRSCVYEWREYMTYEVEVLSSANVDTDHGSYIYS